ncbi:MAG: vWA domain-containing protein [Leadbetterella sp.]
MKTIKQLCLAIISVSLLLLYSCGGGNDAKPRTFQIFIDYWNATGKSPEIRFDGKQTSAEVKIDFTKTFGGEAVGANLSKVVIDNFRIVDQNSQNYNIESIKAYEYQATTKTWRNDVEFTMEHGQSQDISVVLVLDRSKSLGSDFETVKTYANNFIDKLFAERKSIKIGIVDFADNINSFPLSTDKEAIKKYITGLKQGEFTALYQAIDQGIDMLLSSQSQSRVLLTFTDGTDNMAPPNVNSTYLLGRINNDKNSYKITSFYIGLTGKGGVDKDILTKLAAGNGSVSFPETVNELKGVFDRFGKVISNVYNLTYTRNQQIINKASPSKLRFDIMTTSR